MCSMYDHVTTAQSSHVVENAIIMRCNLRLLRSMRIPHKFTIKKNTATNRPRVRAAIAKTYGT